MKIPKPGKASTNQDILQAGIPTFDDIKQLALNEPTLHQCYTYLHQGNITLEQFYLICIVAYVEETQRLRDHILLQFQKSLTPAYHPQEEQEQ